MNRESFLETVKKQYTDEIHEAYLECEHEGTVDLKALNQRIKKLMSNAKVEGLAPKEFEDLVRTTIPDVAGKLDFKAGTGNKKAA